ncbi:uncharacterized protein [Rutidosis leptorrhynchoides]|uniref:uncharacterized protein n=1 Tax=Rutidosis leptorrhynchoides TaxID=125765 RepID=UPI003A99B95A
MGHRHVFSPSIMFETENDQRWNLTDHPCDQTAHSDAAESSSHTYPANNMSINGEDYASNCNSSPVSNAYSSISNNNQTQHDQQDTSGPSDLPTRPETNGNHAPSSSYNGQPVNEDDSFDIRTSNERWRRKRKSLDTSTDGTNGYINHHVGGSSSNISMHTSPWEETRNMDFFRTRWDYRNNVKPVYGDENSHRNVKSRTTPNGPPVDDSSNGSMSQWNPTNTPFVHCHELNPFSVESGSFSENVPQDFMCTEMQNVGGTWRNYIQRSDPSLRASSSSLQLGTADEGLQLTNEHYLSPHPRSTIVWHSSDRNARSRMSFDRYTSFSEDANAHDQQSPEGLMIMEQSAFGSRNLFDHHREMRLDIDDMSYEELLALGERIGTVNTGLSEDMISKCLRESIYCSSDQIQEERTCVICLEEYANMDDVGMFKGCKHDFHVGCIKKWLSIKNLCPICKSEPMKHK